jgi:hypothetical protein
MNRVEREKRRTAIRAGILVGVVGFVIINLGVLALLNGHLHYANYWGGWVFAPYAIGGGILTIFVAVRFATRRR